MDIWMNMGFAWLSILLVVLLTIIYILRIIIDKSSDKDNALTRTNSFLRKHHKFLGVGLVLTGLIHGLFSSDDLLSFNIGTLAWVVSILLGINFMIRKKLGKFKGWMYYHRLLTALFLFTIVWHVVDVGGIQVQNLLFSDVRSTPTIDDSIFSASSSDSNSQENSDSNDNVEITLADGTYTGEATGYRDGLKVSVNVEDGMITQVEVTDHNEVNSKFYAEPIESIPAAIIEAQTTEVDTISGATFTSIGIINAVNNALSDALISGTLPDTQALPENSGHHGGRLKFRP